MMRARSGWKIAVVLAIVVAAAVFAARTERPEEVDPVREAVEPMEQQLGLEVAMDAKNGRGVEVKKVESGGAADHLGLKKGDLIRAVGDRTVWHTKNLSDFVGQDMEQQGGTSLVVESEGVFRSVVMGNPGSIGSGARAQGGMPGHTIPGGRGPRGGPMEAERGRGPGPMGARGG